MDCLVKVFYLIGLNVKQTREVSYYKKTTNPITSTDKNTIIKANDEEIIRLKNVIQARKNQEHKQKLKIF